MGYKYPDREAQMGVGKIFNGDQDYLANFREEAHPCAISICGTSG